MQGSRRRIGGLGGAHGFLGSKIASTKKQTRMLVKAADGDIRKSVL